MIRFWQMRVMAFVAEIIEFFLMLDRKLLGEVVFEHEEPEVQSHFRLRHQRGRRLAIYLIVHLFLLDFHRQQIIMALSSRYTSNRFCHRKSKDVRSALSQVITKNFTLPTLCFGWPSQHPPTKPPQWLGKWPLMTRLFILYESLIQVFIYFLNQMRKSRQCQQSLVSLSLDQLRDNLEVELEKSGASSCYRCCRLLQRGSFIFAGTGIQCVGCFAKSVKGGQDYLVADSLARKYISESDLSPQEEVNLTQAIGRWRVGGLQKIREELREGVRCETTSGIRDSLRSREEDKSHNSPILNYFEPGRTSPIRKKDAGSRRVESTAMNNEGTATRSLFRQLSQIQYEISDYLLSSTHEDSVEKTLRYLRACKRNQIDLLGRIEDKLEEQTKILVSYQKLSDFECPRKEQNRSAAAQRRLPQLDNVSRDALRMKRGQQKLMKQFRKLQIAQRIHLEHNKGIKSINYAKRCNSGSFESKTGCKGAGKIKPGFGKTWIISKIKSKKFMQRWRTMRRRENHQLVLLERTSPVSGSD